MITIRTNIILKKMVQKSLILFAVCAAFGVSSAIGQTITYFQTGEEFVGPFPSWKNIKTDFGVNCAKGDNSTDDAAAINSAMQSMANTAVNTWNVLYFPAGTYVIKSTVRNVPLNNGNSGWRIDGEDYSGMTIIGEDPANTIIKWQGNNTSTMMIMDGWKQRLSRITFDGQGIAARGLSHEGKFSTGNEFSDLVFKDMQNAIDMSSAASGQGQAETSFLRCRFTNISNFGITGCNYNTLDLYTWYCLFEDCGTAINGCIGQFQVFQNVFLRSKVADINGGTCSWSITNNISVGSKSFRSGIAQTTLLHGNKIYNVQSPIDLSGWSTPYACIDNIITRSTPSLPPFSTTNDNAWPTPNQSIKLFTEIFLLGNTFTTSTPVAFTGGTVKDSFPYAEFGTKLVAAASVTPPSTISLPGAPQNKHRTIFEVPAGDDGTKLQAMIISACSTTVYGERAVVHLAKGAYNIKKTIIVPGRRNIQIIGDGDGSGNLTRLNWAGTSTGPLMQLRGPSRATLKDMHLYANFDAGNIEILAIEQADQIGGRIFTQRVLSGGPDAARYSDIGILVDSVEHSDVTLICGGLMQANNGGLKVVGGPTLNSGGTTNGQICLLSGASSNSYNLLNVANGGKIIAEGMWFEGTMIKPLISLVKTKGDITIAGMHWSNANPAPMFNFEDYDGTFTFISNDVDHAPYSYIRLAGNGSNANVSSLCQNYRGHDVSGSRNSMPIDSVWCDSTSPVANSLFWGCGSGYGNTWRPLQSLSGKTHLSSRAVPDSNAVYKALEHLRSIRIEPPMDRTDTAVTDVKMYNVIVNGTLGRTAMHIKRGAGVPIGILDNPYNRSFGNLANRIDKVAMAGSVLRIPQGVKRIMVYNVQGRLVFEKRLSGPQDIYTAEKGIQDMSRHSMLIARMYMSDK